MASNTVPTYWDYLKLDQLLNLQSGLEENDEDIVPDELHFIVVHQAFELWFKLIIRELRIAISHLGAARLPEDRVPYVVHHLRRVNQILHLAVDQFQVMETLTPQDFLGFRDKLVPASGFQSFQMREIEILLGLRPEDRVTYGATNPLDHIQKMAQKSPAGAHAWGRITKALAEQSLRNALHNWLYRTPIDGSAPGDPGDEATVENFLNQYMEQVARVHDAQIVHHINAGLGEPAQLRERFDMATELSRAYLFAEDEEEGPTRERVRRARAALVFIESYRHLPLLAWPRLLIDAIVECEEQLVIFRSRHARMVERIIGRRVGTGGSSGVDYLDKTTSMRIFSDLWTVRTLLLPKKSLPALENESFYGFVGEKE